MGTKSAQQHIAGLIEDTNEEKRKNRILLVIFVVAVLGFLLLLYYRPPFSNPSIFQEVSFPPSAQDLYRVSQVNIENIQVLIEYQNQHYYFSLAIFVYLYTLLQAFAIPGPIFLCVLAPILYGAIGGYFLALTVRI